LFYRSGNPRSLASVRTPSAWHSAWLSLDLGTKYLLEAGDAPRTRTVCADLFQQLAYDAYLESPAIADAAERRATELGGSSVPMSGGAMFAALRGTFGWKRAKQIKRLAYAFGYSRVARLKETAAGTVR
jgi:hypothetical protein